MGVGPDEIPSQALLVCFFTVLVKRLQLLKVPGIDGVVNTSCTR